MLLAYPIVSQTR